MNVKTISKKGFSEIFPSFRDGSDNLISEIISAAHYKTFPEGLHIYLEGDSCGAIAFLLSGEIRVYKTAESGREITLYEIGKGETCILNASCILSGMPYPANAVSTVAGEMLLIPSSDFRRLTAKYEKMRDFVFELLSRRLAAVMSLVEEVTFGKMDERLFDYISKKAKDGGLKTTHQEIAGDLGTSREVVSRLLKDFERRGKVRLARNSIQLLNF